MKHFFVILCVVFSIQIKGQSKNTGSFFIQISHKIKHQLLHLDSSWYENSLGQKYYITKLKYYISDIKLGVDDSMLFSSKKVFLIDEEDPSSKVLQLDSVKNRNFNTIRFTIGLDSSRNVQGTEEGALDPIHAMYWTWNSGYIFFKFEGKSPNSSATGKILEYHIGGFREPYINSCMIELKSKKSFVNSINNSKTVTISADISKLFDNKTPIDFAKTPVITEPKNASKLVKNIQTIFELDEN